MNNGSRSAPAKCAVPEYDDAKLRDDARELVRLHGKHRAAKRLGLSPGALANLLADLDVQNGTKALVERSLRVLASRGSR